MVGGAAGRLRAHAQDRRSEGASSGEGGWTMVKPASPVECAMVGIWANLLRTDAECLSMRDSFFDVGGHSLLATRLVSSLQETFRVEYPLSLLFKGPTLKQVSSAVEALAAGATVDDVGPPPARFSAAGSSFCEGSSRPCSFPTAAAFSRGR